MINKLSKYIIPFYGLKDGIYEFNFLIDNNFFELFEYSEIKKGSINVKVELVKKLQLMELHFDINGNIDINCDRCLDNFLLPVSYKTILYVKTGDIFEEIDDNIIKIPYSENEINISQYIYEFINLSLPYRRVHPNDSDGQSLCNKQMLEKINQYIKKD